MKTKNLLSIFLLCSGWLGAQCPAATHQPQLPPPVEECCSHLAAGETEPAHIAEPCTYLRFGASRFSFCSGESIGPSIHLGRRYEFRDAAVDISLNWAQSEREEGDSSHQFFSAPRIGYLIYTSPSLVGSIVLGPSVSWVYLRENSSSSFNGVALGGTLGYELHRCGSIRAMVQFDVCQPLLAVKKSGDSLPRPMLSLSFGAGF